MKLKYCILVCNAIICFSFGFGVLVFNQIGKPFIRGFYCNDNSINKPFRENTLPSSTVITISFCMSAFIFAVVETFKVVAGMQRSQLSNAVATNKMNIIKNFVTIFFLFVYGVGITTFITDVGKYSVGRLRPNFLAVCKPNWSMINCTVDNHDNFIVGNQFCLADNNSKLRSARLSFPSGHASFSAFSATFHIIYIEMRLKPYHTFAIVPKFLIQVIIGILAFYCGLTRISDNKHHPTDVLAGSLLGLFVAVIIFVFVVKPIFIRNKQTFIVDKELKQLEESNATNCP